MQLSIKQIIDLSGAKNSANRQLWYALSHLHNVYADTSYTLTDRDIAQILQNLDNLQQETWAIQQRGGDDLFGEPIEVSMRARRADISAGRDAIQTIAKIIGVEV